MSVQSISCPQFKLAGSTSILRTMQSTTILKFFFIFTFFVSFLHATPTPTNGELSVLNARQVLPLIPHDSSRNIITCGYNSQNGVTAYITLYRRDRGNNEKGFHWAFFLGDENSLQGTAIDYKLVGGQLQPEIRRGATLNTAGRYLVRFKIGTVTKTHEETVTSMWNKSKNITPGPGCEAFTCRTWLKDAVEKWKKNNLVTFDPQFSTWANIEAHGNQVAQAAEKAKTS